jgi:hypothetical protein
MDVLSITDFSVTGQRKEVYSVSDGQAVGIMIPDGRGNSAIA